MNYLHIFIVILLIIFTLFYTMLAIIFLHSRFHSFWRNQPVAWTTFFSSQEGIIQKKWQKPPTYQYEHNYKVLTPQNILPYKNQIISLWKLCHKSVDLTIFTNKITWILLIHNNQIIGSCR